MKHSFFANKSCVIFDFDGTLADTLSENYTLDNEILSKFNKSLTWDEYHELGGLTYNDLYKEFVHRFQLNVDYTTLLEERQQIFFTKYVPNFKLFKNVIELITQLKNLGYKVGIASASSMDIFTVFLKNNPNFAKLIDLIVTCDELGISKPTPIVYAECIKRLGATVEQSVIFEDTYVGLIGAKQVGCPVCCFLSATDKEVEKRNLADITILEYSELL
ncbi:Beta-phosphoglucomutase [Hexamita inflata]|uniref:Beta-phosphoglucomutase n=1 Tax=Hexamita inflata TaxID=28002 RepID=A0ABP1IL36_9EUKA